MRRKPLQRNRQKRQPVDRALEKRYWRMAVTRGGCVMCRAFPVPRDIRADRFTELRRIEGHHVLARRHLRVAGLEHRFWDVRNGMGLCAYHHHRHEWALQRVPYELVPDDAFEFAIECGLLTHIEREYPSAPS